MVYVWNFMGFSHEDHVARAQLDSALFITRPTHKHALNVSTMALQEPLAAQVVHRGPAVLAVVLRAVALVAQHVRLAAAACVAVNCRLCRSL